MNGKISSNFIQEFIEACSRVRLRTDASLLERVHAVNPWFIPAFTNRRLDDTLCIPEPDKANMAALLDFRPEETSPRHIGIVAAGNIPLVCWHDFVCVLAYIERHPLECVLEIKLSRKDNVLLPAIVEALEHEMNSGASVFRQIRFTTRPDPGVQALLFTGGAGAEAYYRGAFPGCPILVRTGRTSAGILRGGESAEELSALARDCFLFFGLGCRNVSFLWVPRGYDFGPFTRETERTMGPVLRSHEGYMNAFRHARAISLMEAENAHEETICKRCFVLKKSGDMNPSVAVLHYMEYDHPEEIEEHLKANADRIQCVSGTPEVPYGRAQSPDFTQFADRLNTIEWLQKL